MADIFLTRREYERLLSEMRGLRSDRDEITHFFIRDALDQPDKNRPKEPVEIRFRKQTHAAGGWEWVAVDEIYVGDEAMTREI